MKTPLHSVPEDYHEVKLLVATERQLLIRLNIAGIVLAVVVLLLMDQWWHTAQRWRGVAGSPLLDTLPFLGRLVMVVVIIVLTFGLHEWLHGLAIRWMGHRPRYGMRLDMGVLYATADDAYFPRNQFIVIALAPLVVITLGGMVLMLLVSDALAYYIGVMIVLNASGAVGDLWMTWEVLRYPAHALVRDEADRIRIYLPRD
ncbi:MAG: DUF3267 domain-containing protein [Anaerolineae bacterium]|nr:DUF3267 domain-containing protein [Anaerolineae bacterium]